MADLQKRLQTLRQQLDDSIRLYYCQQQQQAAMNRSNRSGRSSSSVTVKNRRTLHMLHQDETSACIQISEIHQLSFLHVLAATNSIVYAISKRNKHLMAANISSVNIPYEVTDY
ncbi:hypothetical protein WUBG_10912 [Wuchereria bancrofti]|uniref:Uncharacterized protein n=1 Tax=Wuchereria bancrofti TaxID=6293 RepID=J9ESE7_WUCBA|nr:hypothetical protein WUBG_10912 [Wuchereria bancrofti]VDM10350.1 unnamed protein product [Wuchereria bancrofti]